MKSKPKSKPAQPKKSQPTRSRRKRTDSIAGAQNAAVAAAAGPLAPPAHIKLRPSDAPYWKAIVCARAREMWTDIDLIMAATLARTLNDVDIQTGLLQREGASITNARGTKVANPRINAITQLTDRATRMMRLLHVHPAATAGRSELEGKVARAEREAEATAQAEGMGADEADLLASFGPVH